MGADDRIENAPFACQTCKMIHWDVSPEIFSIGPITLRWYGMLFASGFLLAYYVMMAMYRRDGRKVEDVGSLLTHMVIGTVIGARLGHCLFYEPDYYLADPLKILKVWEGGLASHGATLGIIASAWIFSKKKKDQPFFWLLDRLCVVVPLAGTMIRLGNLMNSEIIGRPTESSWGFVFPRVDDKLRHPAQLYEAITYLIIFAIMWALYRWKGRPDRGGFLFGAMLVLLFSSRILIEFVKEAQVSWENEMTFNMGQLLSVPFIILGIYFVIRELRARSGP